jgi:capsular exopolysaccharide synthesis family protein
VPPDLSHKPTLAPTKADPLHLQPAQEEGINPTIAWQMVRKYWSTALLAAVVVSLLTAFNTLGQVKIYESHATILFDPNPPRPLGQKVESIVDLGSGNFWDNREYYETQYKIIQSMKVALAVVGDLGLAHDEAFLNNSPPGMAPQPLGPQTNVSEEIAAEALRSRLRVEPVKESRLATVKFEDADPQRAQRILTAIVDTYVQQNLDDAVSSTAVAADWLRSQLDKLKVDLESSEMALHKYKEEQNILSVALDDQSNMLTDELKQLNEAITTVRTRKEEVAARRDELARIKQDSPTDLPATELLQSTVLTNLRQTYEEALRLRDGLKGEGKGSNHPDVKEADAKADATRRALLMEVRNIQRALNKDFQVLQRQETGLVTLFEKTQKQALDLNLLEIEYNRLRRSRDNNDKLYSLVLERTKESDLARVLRVNNIRVLDRPRVPRFHVRPNIPKNISLGIFIGIILGVGMALARGLLDRTLRTPDDIEKGLGLPFLGSLPQIDHMLKATPYGRRRRGEHMKVSRPELAVHEQPMSGVAEAARVIRTSLLFMDPDKPYRTLLVTSAGPSEGKTTVATCIAITLAQTGQRVVLVDCDLRRPRVHRVFPTGTEVGVTTCLIEGSIDDAVFESGVPNLSIIPAGPIPPNPAELLHSDKFRQFLQQLQDKFDRVVIDSPPIVPVTDAAILSTLVDGTVLVVRALKTTKDLAKVAVRALQDIGVPKAGAVLNGVTFTGDEYRYRYQYYRRDDDEVEPAGKAPKVRMRDEAPRSEEPKESAP